MYSVYRNSLGGAKTGSVRHLISSNPTRPLQFGSYLKQLFQSSLYITLNMWKEKTKQIISQMEKQNQARSCCYKCIYQKKFVHKGRATQMDQTTIQIFIMWKHIKIDKLKKWQDEITTMLNQNCSSSKCNHTPLKNVPKMQN